MLLRLWTTAFTLLGLACCSAAKVQRGISRQKDAEKLLNLAFQVKQLPLFQNTVFTNAIQKNEIDVFQLQQLLQDSQFNLQNAQDCTNNRSEWLKPLLDNNKIYESIMTKSYRHILAMNHICGNSTDVLIEDIKNGDLDTTGRLIGPLIYLLPFSVATPDVITLSYTTAGIVMFSENVRLGTSENILEDILKAVVTQIELKPHEKYQLLQLEATLSNIYLPKFPSLLLLIKKSDYPRDVINARDILIEALEKNIIKANPPNGWTSRPDQLLSLLTSLLHTPNDNKYAAYIHVLFSHYRLQYLSFMGYTFKPRTLPDIAFLLNSFLTIRHPALIREIYNEFTKITWQTYVNEIDYTIYSNPRILFLDMLRAILNHSEGLKVCNAIVINYFINADRDSCPDWLDHTFPHDENPQPIEITPPSPEECVPSKDSQCPGQEVQYIDSKSLVEIIDSTYDAQFIVNILSYEPVRRDKYPHQTREDVVRAILQDFKKQLPQNDMRLYVINQAILKLTLNEKKTWSPKYINLCPSDVDKIKGVLPEIDLPQGKEDSNEPPDDNDSCDDTPDECHKVSVINQQSLIDIITEGRITPIKNVIFLSPIFANDYIGIETREELLKKVLMDRKELLNDEMLDFIIPQAVARLPISEDGDLPPIVEEICDYQLQYNITFPDTNDEPDIVTEPEKPCTIELTIDPESLFETIYDSKTTTLIKKVLSSKEILASHYNAYNTRENVLKALLMGENEFTESLQNYGIHQAFSLIRLNWKKDLPVYYFNVCSSDYDDDIWGTTIPGLNDKPIPCDNEPNLSTLSSEGVKTTETPDEIYPDSSGEESTGCSQENTTPRNELTDYPDEIITPTDSTSYDESCPSGEDEQPEPSKETTESPSEESTPGPETTSSSGEDDGITPPTESPSKEQPDPSEERTEATPGPETTSSSGEDDGLTPPTDSPSQEEPCPSEETTEAPSEETTPGPEKTSSSGEDDGITPPTDSPSQEEPCPSDENTESPSDHISREPDSNSGEDSKGQPSDEDTTSPMDDTFPPTDSPSKEQPDPSEERTEPPSEETTPGPEKTSSSGEDDGITPPTDSPSQEEPCPSDENTESPSDHISREPDSGSGEHNESQPPAESQTKEEATTIRPEVETTESIEITPTEMQPEDEIPCSEGSSDEKEPNHQTSTPPDAEELPDCEEGEIPIQGSPGNDLMSSILDIVNHKKHCKQKELNCLEDESKAAIVIIDSLWDALGEEAPRAPYIRNKVQTYVVPIDISREYTKAEVLRDILHKVREDVRDPRVLHNVDQLIKCIRFEGPGLESPRFGYACIPNDQIDNTEQPPQLSCKLGEVTHTVVQTDSLFVALSPYAPKAPYIRNKIRDYLVPVDRSKVYTKGEVLAEILVSLKEEVTDSRIVNNINLLLKYIRKDGPALEEPELVDMCLPESTTEEPTPAPTRKPTTHKPKPTPSSRPPTQKPVTPTSTVPLKPITTFPDEDEVTTTPTPPLENSSEEPVAESTPEYTTEPENCSSEESTEFPPTQSTETEPSSEEPTTEPELESCEDDPTDTPDSNIGTEIPTEVPPIDPEIPTESTPPEPFDTEKPFEPTTNEPVGESSTDSPLSDCPCSPDKKLLKVVANKNIIKLLSLTDTHVRDKMLQLILPLSKYYNKNRMDILKSVLSEIISKDDAYTVVAHCVDPGTDAPQIDTICVPNEFAYNYPTDVINCGESPKINCHYPIEIIVPDSLLSAIDQNAISKAPDMVNILMNSSFEKSIYEHLGTRSEIIRKLLSEMITIATEKLKELEARSSGKVAIVKQWITQLEILSSGVSCSGAGGLIPDYILTCVERAKNCTDVPCRSNEHSILKRALQTAISDVPVPPTGRRKIKKTRIIYTTKETINVTVQATMPSTEAKPNEEVERMSAILAEEQKNPEGRIAEQINKATYLTDKLINQ